MKKRTILSLGLAATIGIIAFFIFFSWAKARLPELVKNPALNSSLSRAVSKAIKVDGQFGPLSLKNWTVSTPYFSGKGWPGEAIGLLEATNIHAVFNPGAIFRRVWQLDRIDVTTGRFALRTPNDALKINPPAGKRPWYAALMPQRFYCPKIECQRAEVEFPFQNSTGVLHQVHIDATMIGRDFKYFIKDGTLHFPLLPALTIEKLNLFITRDKTDIEEAILTGQGTNFSKVVLQGRIGMRKDKSISAKLAVQELPFTQTLPPLLKDRLKGLITGDMVWETDSSGKNTVSTGKLKLLETHLEAWPWLENIAQRYKNPDLLKMDFDQAECNFDYRNDRFKVDQLDLHARNKVRLKGWAAYDWKTSEGEFTFDFSEMPLASWLEMSLKPRLNAELRGKLWWKGALREIEGSQASGNIILDGAELINPPRLKKFLNSYSLRCPDYFQFERARSDFVYWNQNFQATSFEFYAPKHLQVKGKFDWSSNNQLTLKSQFHLKDIGIFLPQRFEKNILGNLDGLVNWSGNKKDLGEGSGSGVLNINSGEIRDLKILKSLSRFFKDDSFIRLILDRASLKWEKRSNGQLLFSNIDLLSAGKCGLKGNLVLDKNTNLSGRLKIGLKAEALKWLPRAEITVFKEKREGLCWATVTVSGTLQKPDENLTSQIKKELIRHPTALFGLALRGASWWLGNLFSSKD